MSVRETVIDAMQANGLAGYTSQAAPVIRALETREDEIVSNLITFAEDKGLDRQSAMQGLADCGLYVQAPAIAAVDPRIAEMESAIEAMQETLRSMRG